MAGIVSSSTFEDHQTTLSGRLEFIFDIESTPTELVDRSNISSNNSFFSLSGEVEFLKQRKRFYWRYFIPVLIIAILSISIFSFSKDTIHHITASLHSAVVKEKQVVNKVVVLETTSTSISTTAAAADLKTIDPLSKTLPQFEEKSQVEELAKEIKPTKNIIQETKSQKSKPLETIDVQKEIVAISDEDYKTKNLIIARKLSQKTGRYTFIKFGADWCTSCKIMENNALKNENIVDLLAQKFIVLDVDIDEPNGAKIKEEYYVNKLPTIIILDELGNQMRRKEGGTGATAILEMLESVAQYIYLEEEETITATVGEVVGE